MVEYKCYIYFLVLEGKLDCELECIFGDEELYDCIINGKGLVWVELLILLLYIKVILKDEFIYLGLFDDEYICYEMEKVFLQVLVECFSKFFY